MGREGERRDGEDRKGEKGRTWERTGGRPLPYEEKKEKSAPMY